LRKKFVFTCLLLSGCLLLPGCSRLFIVRADKLLAAPAASALQLEIIKGFERQHKQPYTLQAPIYGEYVSSFLMRDIDSDEEDEAVFFYQTDHGNKNICCCVMDHHQGEWELSADIEGPAGRVYDVAFADMNADGFEEIVIGWYFGDFSRNKLLTINGKTSPDKQYSVLAAEPFCEKLIEDIDGNGSDDLFVVVSDFSSVSSRAYAKLLVMKNGAVKLASQARIDSKASGYSRLKGEKATDSSPLRIYIDTVKGENQMITDVVYWDIGTASLVSMLMDNETLTNKIAPRPANIASFDINNDGVIEIPCQETQPLEGGAVYISQGEQAAPFFMTGWLAVEQKNGTKTVMRTACNTDEGYYMNFPPLQNGKAAVASYIYDRRWDIISTQTNGVKPETLFSVKVFEPPQWQKENNASGKYRELFTTALGVAGVSITPAGFSQGLTYSNIGAYFGLTGKGEQ